MLLQRIKTSAKLFFMNHFINIFSGCGFCRVLAPLKFVFQKKAQTIGKCLKVEGYTPVPKHREKRKSFLFFFQKQKDWSVPKCREQENGWENAQAFWCKIL